jgi:hypothetical protein
MGARAGVEAIVPARSCAAPTCVEILSRRGTPFAHGRRSFGPRAGSDSAACRTVNGGQQFIDAP